MALRRTTSYPAAQLALLDRRPWLRYPCGCCCRPVRGLLPPAGSVPHCTLPSPSSKRALRIDCGLRREDTDQLRKYGAALATVFVRAGFRCGCKWQRRPHPAEPNLARAPLAGARATWGGLFWRQKVLAWAVARRTLAEPRAQGRRPASIAASAHGLGQRLGKPHPRWRPGQQRPLRAGARSCGAGCSTVSSSEPMQAPGP